MLLPIIKFIDKSLSTLKTITLFNGQYLLSAILEGISEIIFAYVVVGLVGSKSFSVVLAIAVAGGLGKYVTCKLSDRFSKDKTYVNVITGDAKSNSELVKLYNFCLEHNIKAFLYDTYDKEMNKSLTLQIHAETKDDSRLVDKFINECDHSLLRRII